MQSLNFGIDFLPFGSPLRLWLPPHCAHVPASSPQLVFHQREQHEPGVHLPVLLPGDAHHGLVPNRRAGGTVPEPDEGAQEPQPRGHARRGRGGHEHQR